MALFPKIQSPCPYKNNLASVMDGDMCGMCKRRVVDLTAMTDGQRIAFMQSCKEEVCVSYSVRPALAAAALAVAAVTAPTAALACTDNSMIEIVVGGIKDVNNVKYVRYADDPADRATPALPVVYDDKPADKAPAAPRKVTPPGGV